MSNSDSSCEDDIALSDVKRRTNSGVEEDSPGKTNPPQKQSSSAMRSSSSSDENAGPNSESEEEESAMNAQESKTKDASGHESNSNDDASEKIENPKKKSKKRKRSSSVSSDGKTESSSVESEDEDDEKEQAIMKKKKVEKQTKRSNEESSKIIRLKRYLTVAGIRIRNYSKLFAGCKSKKSKEAKLLELLENEGLKGKPTLEKCKKLRKKIEAQREVAELDLGNIIDGKDNLTSRCSRTTRNRLRSTEIEKEKVSRREEVVNPFGNLSGIIDADESYENDGKATTKPKKKRQKFIESDQESVESGIEGDEIDPLSASPISD